ncbi:spore germination lipoprotein GerD [Paenibacillus sp. GCM10023252]|uniref:spore germination lipoprotein GerD n=1 Tax=Paenibacillus sp. GCM10023252 TaxID=3252649 RepID=UPI003621CFAD
MRNYWAHLVLITAMLFVLTSCGAEPSGGSSQQMSYKDMKSMVIDILKTEDAQKALQESTASGYKGSGGTTMLSVQDQEQVRLSVKDVLVSPEYDKVIKSLMTDTKFAGEFAKAVNKQNKEIHKALLKDPSYQADLIKVMKNPEMDKMILEVLQSTQYRKQVMTMMQEAMGNPLFRVEVLDLMKEAVRTELKPKPDEKVEKKKKEEEDGGEEDSGGGEGGSEEDGGGEDGGM